MEEMQSMVTIALRTGMHVKAELRDIIKLISH